MPMNELFKAKTFCLLANTSQVTNKRMKNAYESVVTEVVTFSFGLNCKRERDFCPVLSLLCGMKH